MKSVREGRKEETLQFSTDPLLCSFIGETLYIAQDQNPQTEILTLFYQTGLKVISFKYKSQNCDKNNFHIPPLRCFLMLSNLCQMRPLAKLNFKSSMYKTLQNPEEKFKGTKEFQTSASTCISGSSFQMRLDSSSGLTLVTPPDVERDSNFYQSGFYHEILKINQNRSV